MNIILLLVPVWLFAASETTTTAYVNGYWFDGSRFSRRTAYVVGDVLSFRPPKHVDASEDLHDGYVVPPFAEAHNHNVEPLNDVPKLIATYLEHGIFYVKNPNNLARDREALAPLINRPESIDVLFANGGWTRSGGHPAEIVKRLVERHLWTEADGDGGFYWAADTPADVERKWAAFLERQPQFVKTYLLFSDDGKREAQPDTYFGWRGLAPQALRAIVVRAHRANLRVSAHIETAHDFHEALNAGVDEINHMPGFRTTGDVEAHPISDFELSEGDAAVAQRQGVVVVTTLVGATKLDGARRSQQDALNTRNLRRLIAHRVKLGVGSDSYREDSLAEAVYLASLHAISNTTLLKMWTETTAAAIYPHRKIGKLREGYEASFLVLAGDPLADFANVTRITRRVKQGHRLP